MADLTTSSPAVEFVPADSDARSTIVKRLDQTLFVEASAGTGKTTSLVERVCKPCRHWHNHARPDCRHHLHRAGRRRAPRPGAATSGTGGRRREPRRCGKAAAAGKVQPTWTRPLSAHSTHSLHSCCTNVHWKRDCRRDSTPPTKSPPVSSSTTLGGAWLNDALEGKSALAADLATALTLGMTPDDMRGVALEFQRNYADLHGVSFGTTDAPATLAAPLVPSPSGGGWGPPLDSARELERLCDFAKLGSEDPLVTHVHGKLPSLRRLAAAEPGTPASLRLLVRLLPLSSGRGNQRNWDVDPLSGDNACSALKATLKELHDSAITEVAQARSACLLPILDALRDFALDYVEQRRAEGAGRIPRPAHLGARPAPGQPGGARPFPQQVFATS